MLGGLLVGYGTRHFVSAFYFVNHLRTYPLVTRLYVQSKRQPRLGSY